MLKSRYIINIYRYLRDINLKFQVIIPTVKESFRQLVRNPYFWLVLIAFSIRLATLGLYPLIDTTEARYIEMARKMIETGNWIMPQFDYGVPFWGKPPLSIWFNSVIFKIFGINEFSARLPSVIIGFLITALVFCLAKSQRGKTVAWIAVTLLITNPMFFILSGAVIMDPMMALGTTLSMVSFWQAIKVGGQYWGYLFFIGIAIGLMSKGPIAAILTIMPIFMWLSISGNWKHIWQSIPLVKGTMLCLILTLPWYLLAEYETPGFLNYFIIGEHWVRFTQTGWVSLYGTSHAYYLGAIWEEWLKAAFPLSLILVVTLLTLIFRKRYASISILKEEWLLYLILWVISPILFFTFSRNILPTYLLPGLPAAAILVAGLWQKRPFAVKEGKEKNRKSIAVISMAWGGVFPLLFLALVIFYIPNVSDMKTEKFLIEKYRNIDLTGQARLVYLYERPYSAEFYSAGKAELITDTTEILKAANQSNPIYIAVKEKGALKMLMRCANKIGKYGRYTLFKLNQQYCK